MVTWKEHEINTIRNLLPEDGRITAGIIAAASEQLPSRTAAAIKKKVPRGKDEQRRTEGGESHPLDRRGDTETRSRISATSPSKNNKGASRGLETTLPVPNSESN